MFTNTNVLKRKSRFEPKPFPKRACVGSASFEEGHTRHAHPAPVVSTQNTVAYASSASAPSTVASSSVAAVLVASASILAANTTPDPVTPAQNIAANMSSVSTPSTVISSTTIPAPVVLAQNTETTTPSGSASSTIIPAPVVPAKRESHARWHASPTIKKRCVSLGDGRLFYAANITRYPQPSPARPQFTSWDRSKGRYPSMAATRACRLRSYLRKYQMDTPQASPKCRLRECLRELLHSLGNAALACLHAAENGDKNPASHDNSTANEEHADDNHTAALNTVSEGTITSSAVSNGAVASSAESKHAVALSSDNNRIANPSANDDSTVVQSANSDHTAGQGTESKGIAEPNAESKHIVAPSVGVANMDQCGADICNAARSKYSGSLDTVGFGTTYAHTQPEMQSGFRASTVVFTRNAFAGFIASSSKRPAGQGTSATSVPVLEPFSDQPNAQPTLGMDTSVSTQSFSSNIFGANGFQQQFGGYAPHSVYSSGSWPQPASTSDWPVYPHGTFIDVAGEQVNTVAEGDIESDAEDDIEVDVDNVMEERGDTFMDEDADAAMEKHTYATTDERADAAMEDAPVAPRGMEENPREGACDFSASYSRASQFVADGRSALFGATASRGAGATQFGAASSSSSGVASRFALFGAPRSPNSGAGNSFGASALQFGAAGNFGASALQSNATTSFDMTATQFGTANSFDMGSAQSGGVNSFGTSATQLYVANEQSLGATQSSVLGGYGAGAANSDLHSKPNEAEDLGWDTGGFMAGDTYSNPANMSNSVTDHNSNGKSSAGPGSTAATGDDLTSMPIPATMPGDNSIGNMAAAYAPTPGTDADAALASAPSTDPSDDSIPATATSVSGIVDMVTSLRPGVGADASTAMVQASAADSAPVASTSKTVYAKERDGIHEYKETLKASGTVPVYRPTLPARLQPTEGPDVSQISEMANGLSLGTDASEDTSPALHSGGSFGSGSATRSESAEESLSQGTKDCELEALIQRTENIDLDAPPCFDQNTSAMKAPRPYANGIRLSYRHCIRFVLNPGFGH